MPCGPGSDSHVGVQVTAAHDRIDRDDQTEPAVLDGDAPRSRHGDESAPQLCRHVARHECRQILDGFDVDDRQLDAGLVAWGAVASCHVVTVDPLLTGRQRCVLPSCDSLSQSRLQIVYSPSAVSTGEHD